MDQTWVEPCVTCGQFISRMRTGVVDYMPEGSLLLGRRHRMREDFKLDAKLGYGKYRLKMSESLDALSNSLALIRFNVDRLMNLLLTAWWAIRRLDPATPSYVRVAVDLKHTLANLISAIDYVVAWMTGGYIAIPVFGKLEPCVTFEKWAAETFRDSRFWPSVFAPLPSTLDEIRSRINNINDQVPQIYMEMQHIREEHGNDVGMLVSPQQIARRGGFIEIWDGNCNSVRSLDQLRFTLGIVGPHAPVPWGIAHLMHYLSETIVLVQRENPNSGLSDEDDE